MKEDVQHLQGSSFMRGYFLWYCGVLCYFRATHRVIEMTKRQTRKKGRLFNNSPRGTPRVKGTGYGSKEKARRTLKKIKGKPKALQKQIITTMYYRAKYHKYQTEGMRNAMKVYKPFLKGGSAESWIYRSHPAYPELWENRSYPLPADKL